MNILGLKSFLYFIAYVADDFKLTLEQNLSLCSLLSRRNFGPMKTESHWVSFRTFGSLQQENLTHYVSINFNKENILSPSTQTSSKRNTCFKFLLLGGSYGINIGNDHVHKEKT